MHVIACSAQLNSGKDVFSDHLHKILRDKYWRFNWVRKAFAGPVKETFCQSFGVDHDFIEKWKRISQAPPGMLMPVRQALQFIGDGFRQIKPNIWIEIALRDQNISPILSDGRYINEAKAVRESKGLNFLLYRPGFLNDDPNPSEAQLRPLVEFAMRNLKEGAIPNADTLRQRFQEYPFGLDNYDYFLINEGSLQDFYAKIDTVIVPFVIDWFSLS